MDLRDGASALSLCLSVFLCPPLLLSLSLALTLYCRTLAETQRPIHMHKTLERIIKTIVHDHSFHSVHANAWICVTVCAFAHKESAKARNQTIIHDL